MFNFSTNTKKQYIFLLLIVIMLYSLYIISSYKYKEYKVNISISNLIKNIENIKKSIVEANSLIEYKKTKAYVNKVLKSEQGLKNKGEKVIYLTPEKKYNKFTKEKTTKNKVFNINLDTNKDNITKYMSIFDKWLYFLFNK